MGKGATAMSEVRRPDDELPNIRRALKGEAPSKLIPVLVTLDWAGLPYHRLANEYPMADEHEQAAITESIKANGFFPDEPIILFREDGKTWEIADGRNRHFCGNKAGHAWSGANFVEFTGTLAELEKIVRAKGDARRHMSAAQKETRVKALLLKYPNMPSRQLAKIAGVSHTTIANLRKPKEEDQGRVPGPKIGGPAQGSSADQIQNRVCASAKAY
jgi:hypothetical protein